MHVVGQARCVLVVDDEKVIADSLTAILCSCGYTARAAYSAVGAILAAKELIPDAVISDVLMPGVNGIELAAYFAEHHPECRVLLMSGDSSASGLLNVALRQAQPHTTCGKLIDPSHVLEVLAALAPIA